MKVTLEFELPQETEEYKLAMDGAKTRIALDDVWEKIFRPEFKHGYPNERLNELAADPKVSEAIQLLAKIYHEILAENEIT